MINVNKEIWGITTQPSVSKIPGTHTKLTAFLLSTSLQMNSVHSLQQGQACAFDFIQNVVSIVTSELEKNRKNNLIEMEKLEVDNFYNKMKRNNLAETEARKEIMSKQNNLGVNNITINNNNNDNNDNKFGNNGDLKMTEKTLKTTRGIEVPSSGLVPKVALVMPEKKWTEIPEYRNAYLQALNEGLNGQNARDRARSLLVNVLADVSTTLCIY